jgi:ribose 5-phosphate isomerase B
MKIIVASDHAGFAYKTILIKELRNNGYELTDMGTDSDKPPITLIMPPM